MEHHDEVAALRQCIEDFLHERCAEKLKSVKDEAAREAMIARFQRETWLADAARRSEQIKLVTHALKYGHPDARGSNIHAGACGVRPRSPEGYVGTHCCAVLHEDAVGNAAALDVVKFLKLEHQGKTLLQRVMANDETLRAAFCDNSEQAAAWMAAFRRMRDNDAHPASHRLARQIYFPLEQGGYHLLAPLFPTSLVQSVYLTLQEDRFGKRAAEARKARSEERFCEHGYCEYPRLLVCRFGGTKPQNISQLNSERHGESWLLSSMPPFWNSGRVRLPLGVDSVFGPVLNGLPQWRRECQALTNFLEKVAGDYTNIRIRETRAALLDELLTVIVQWAARIREQEAGWSARDECHLPEEERFWLDPLRGEQDPEWQARRDEGSWREALLNRAATWLNGELTTRVLRMGDEERHAWKQELRNAVQQLEEGEWL